ncbi:MAG: hypothetical protein EOP51_33065, partial [Sphingobacteriales bacterium]
MYLVLLLLLIPFNGVHAQSTTNYTFGTSVTGSLALDMNGNAIDMSSGTTALVAAASDQGVSAVTNIGFNFCYMGSVYTQFTVSANGVMQLGSSAVSGSTYVASGGTATAPKFGAITSDAITASAADGGGVTSKLIGTAPNRCLVIQWVSYLYWLNSAAPATFQIRLYETSGVVEYVYGSMPVGATAYSSGYTTGFSTGTAANTLSSVTTATNTSSNTAWTTNTYTAGTNIPNLHSTANGARRTYNFTPSVAAPTSPTSLSFTAVTTAATTINWVDNSSTEVGFTVIRATDAAFTQNVVVANVATTTSAGTGTADRH